MKKIKLSQRILSLVLCLALLMSYGPLSALAATPLAQAAITQAIADPGSADSYEHMMGTDVDGNRYAGRVWADKSVYKNGDTVVLNSKNQSGSSFQVDLEEDEAFQVVFSVLGSSMTHKSTVSKTGPMDVVLILDNSVSMNTASNNVTRMQKVIEAANKLLGDLLDGNDVRLGIAAYSEDASTVLPFGTYEDGVVLRVNNYTGSGSSNGVITAYNKNGTVINRNYKSNGYANYTNTQAGFDLGMEMLAQATNTANRKPVVILLTDGAANTAKDTLFVSGRNATVRQIYHSNNIDPMIATSTLLSAAYNKAVVENHYGKAPMVYGIGVDLSSTDGSNAIIDPANNFNRSNNNANIREAYDTYNTWLTGSDITETSGTGSGFGFGVSSYTFRFGHAYPQGSGITDRAIANNINYVDTYYPVASANLEGTFDQIFEELSSGVFNPISSTTVSNGGTGVENTPLIYVDFIGQYMEVKEIQSVSVFGASYGVIKNADGTYSVSAGTGSNPTTNENWNTAEDIQISVTRQADGTQKLEVRINQEILPSILEQVVTETVGQQTSSTITELLQDPLRVYYTVGVDSHILLPNGEVDVSKIQGYSHIDNANGTVSFYSNRFGVENTADNNNVVAKGDAHVGFRPSAENRYYYHQANQGIFTKITDKNGNTVSIPQNNEYGILWDEDQYDLTWMSYAEYQNVQPSDTVYTYVKYYRPTQSGATQAEEVSYLVYTKWEYLKDSVAFYDNNAQAYLNDGKVIAQADVAGVVSAYLQNNPNAQLYAVLGVGSQRTSRLHNMMVSKQVNSTQTAQERYTPEYLQNKAAHNDNDVVIWLGNNGKLTVQIDTGIALTKTVTEPIGNADDTYALTVTVPAGVTAAPQVLDANGQAVASTYARNVLTVPVKAGQTVYIHGIPGGTECAIGETVNGDYYIASKTDTVTVPTVEQVLAGAAQFAPATVTNAPYEFGDLYITKEISSNHSVPAAVANGEFEITVNLGSTLANSVFRVEDSAHTAAYEKTTDAAGNLVFLLKAAQTVKILDLPAGTTATVTETDPGSHFTVSYSTLNRSGETPDSDNVLTIPADGSATAEVLNHYTPNPVSVDLDIAGTKHFTAEGNHDGGSFTYQVQRWNGQAWEDMAGLTAQTPYAPNESGTKTFTIAEVLAGIQYTQVGNHAYQVIEVKGDVANVTYDRTIFAFDVTVTDNDGQLVATVTDRDNTPITDGSYEVSFHNTYHTAPVSVDIVKIVDNRSGDDTVSKAGFTFTAVQTDAAWAPLTGAEAYSFTAHSDAAGRARFTTTYTTAGQYFYELTEVTKNAPGWTSSTAKYRITVTVSEENGNLSAALSAEKLDSQDQREIAAVDAADATKASVSFVNTYDPADTALELDGTVKKELTGKALTDGQFTFYVYSKGDRSTPVLTGTNKHNGQAHFVDFDQPLILQQAGTYRYEVVEAIPANAVYDAATNRYVLDGMYYDPTVFDLVVEVTHDASAGTLQATHYFVDAVSTLVTFQNSYRTSPTEYTLAGTKLLHGRSPRAGEFSFQLYQVENGTETLLQTVSNKADGSFGFQTIAYTAAGTYTYVIKEAAGNVPGVRYDGVQHPIPVTVTVTDQQGQLQAVASVRNDAIRFENTYVPAGAQVSFLGTKIFEGGTLEDNSFTFNLYATDSAFDVSQAQPLSSVKNTGDTFSFGTSFNAPGTYYFAITEDTSAPAENVVYDRTQHNLSVQVRDLGDGQLTAVVTNMRTGEASAPGASVAAAVTFTNATFEQAAQKEVYLADNTTTTIDGKKVSAGDVLTYFITYTNYTGENVVVDIMDTLPAHTAYVEGTASHGGTYAGSHINWILNVAKGESVTVSFDAKVTHTQAIVANTAVVRDGVNTYTTNQVVNHTVEKVLEKDVASGTETSVSIDGQQVRADQQLVYTIRYTNTSRTPANVTITDRIPANTIYVAGSADNGGVYAGGTLTWELKDVSPWATVTVSFKVTVNATTGAVSITNQAAATDGTNTYQSNQVSNTTVVDTPQNPTPQNPTPITPAPTTPQTGDNMLLHLWLGALFVSTGGLILTAIVGKKKEEETA